MLEYDQVRGMFIAVMMRTFNCDGEQLLIALTGFELLNTMKHPDATQDVILALALDDLLDFCIKLNNENYEARNANLN